MWKLRKHDPINESRSLFVSRTTLRRAFEADWAAIAEPLQSNIGEVGH